MNLLEAFQLVTLTILNLTQQRPVQQMRQQVAVPYALPLSSISGLLLAACEVVVQQTLHPSYPHPELGGQRITTEWLDTISDEEALWRFRFTADELHDVATALDIPEVFVTSSRYRFEAIEAFGLLCARFRTPSDIYVLTSLYNRSIAAISEVVNELTEYLDERWKHLLGFDRNGILSTENLEQYAEAIHDFGAPLDSIWGFLDCTIRQICRPRWFQRAAYNGHKKFHALKFQAIMLPNGLFGHLYGPFEGRRNDNYLLAQSGILEQCALHAIRPNTTNNTPARRRYFQLFGDPAYGLSNQIISPFAGVGERTEDEISWNYAMSRARMAVENGFAFVVNNWPFLNAFWKLRIYQSPIGRYYRVGVLLTNAISCLRPNSVAIRFNCYPPSLEEYFYDT